MSNRNRINLAAIPKKLRGFPNWVNWRIEIVHGKPTKIPVNSKTGGNAKCNEPSTWATFSEVVNYWKAHKKEVSGIGFVFTDSPFSGIDLDECRDPQTGAIEDWAGEIVSELNSYTEVTPSGTGLHIIVRGGLPPGRRRKGNIEMYETGRFFTITGWHLKGTPTSIKARPKELKKLHARIFGVKGPKPSSRSGHNWLRRSLGLSDTDLIRKAMQARNGKEFSLLWSGNWRDYNSQSEADFHLCSSLAFWTRKDPAQMDRLFRQSGLMREKWDERRGSMTYGERTIKRAVEMTRKVHSPAPGRENKEN